ncbi:MAG: metallophosphoesterase [Castellaniella sp.]|uniref:metallophosphoesterase n=1 Tax=Castellaniella sp. TaxID=1955812 RepID=UPI002A35FA69|nr:metallophosphoesterase [Castellaniella sp.]MDY0308975.1 metallophosphoesterase [Castellaniella sp.]
MGTLLPFITGTIWLYVLGRFVWPLPCGLGVRAALALVLFLVAQYHWFTSRFFGSLASPELPQGVLVFLGWAFGAFLLLAMLVLLRDVAGGLIFLFARGAGRAILGGRVLHVSLGVLALVLAAIGTWQAIRVPDVKTVEIRIPGLPPAFDGYRIAQLTDLHASRLLPASWMAAVVAKTNALGADLIVITGDLADGSPEARAADVRPLHDLQAPDGVLAIPGNHEYYADYQRWMLAYRALGLDMLENAHMLIRRGDAVLALAGITDRQAGPFGQLRPDLDAALQGVAPGVPVILLAHRPEGAVRHAQAGVALQLSGHTHGGQILGPHLLTQWANEGFVSGLYRVGAMHLYVSNGTGLWNGLAIRLGRPSEITRIVLRPEVP